MRPLLSIVRFWLPTALMIGGLAIVAIGGGTQVALGIGIPLFSAGAAVRFLNALFRLGVKGDVERTHEESAREFFAIHGRWPIDETE